MTVTLIYRCRLCGGWERRSSEEILVSVDAAGVLHMKGEHRTASHQCSDKMMGVADFAGVEMVEEEEQP